MKKFISTLFIATSVFATSTLNFYCGSTMSKAMRELANKFEEQMNVKIVITKGGSGKLYRELIKMKDVDLYLPGAASYINNDTNNLFTYKKLIGYNKAVILVQKGNPKNIKDLNAFNKPNIKIVIGHKKSGSVGKIAKKILTLFKGEEFYEQVYKRAIKAPTSLEIVQALKNKQADVSINWKAVVFMDDNEEYLDYINIPYIAPKQKLFLTVTKYSKHPMLAKSFVNFVFKHKSFLKKKGF